MPESSCMSERRYSALTWSRGLVTRPVTNYLNLAGLVALVFWGWDIRSTGGLSTRCRWLRWSLWTLLVLTLGLLAGLHVSLDQLIDLDSSSILDSRRFRRLHAWYLNTSTVQWVGSLVLMAVTLIAWQQADKQMAAGKEDGKECES